MTVRKRESHVKVFRKSFSLELRKRETHVEGSFKQVPCYGCFAGGRHV